MSERARERERARESVLIKIIISSPLFKNLLLSSRLSLYLPPGPLIIQHIPPNLLPEPSAEKPLTFSPFSHLNQLNLYLAKPFNFPSSCSAPLSAHSPFLHHKSPETSLARIRLSLKVWEIEEKDYSPATSFGSRRAENMYTQKPTNVGLIV